MPSPSLLLSGIVSIATGATFAFVAATIVRRPTSADTRGANATFGLWWALLGAYLAVQGALTLVAAYGALTLEGYLASRALIIPILCGAVGCLVHHLLFLYTGNPRMSTLAALAYVPVAGLLAYATYGQPQELRVGAWLVGLDDTRPAYRLSYALIGLPPIGASLAYLALLRRVQDPMQRMRVWLVSGSIAAYVGSGLAARLGTSDGVKVVTLVGFGLAAAILVLIAYHPPAAVARLVRRGSS